MQLAHVELETGWLLHGVAWPMEDATNTCACLSCTDGLHFSAFVTPKEVYWLVYQACFSSAQVKVELRSGYVM